MLLLLIRHAHAGDRDAERWPDDRDRPLTDKGRKTQRKVSRWLGEHEYTPTKILASPWARAAETAKILAERAGPAQPPIPSAALATEPDLVRLADEIGEPGATRSWRWSAIRPGWRSWPSSSWLAPKGRSGSTSRRAECWRSTWSKSSPARESCGSS